MNFAFQLNPITSWIMNNTHRILFSLSQATFQFIHISQTHKNKLAIVSRQLFAHTVIMRALISIEFEKQLLAEIRELKHKQCTVRDKLFALCNNELFVHILKSLFE